LLPIPIHSNGAKLRWGALLLLIASVPATAGEFLWLSDVHFDPLADPQIVDRLAAAPVAQWAAILASGSAKFSAFGQDTSWPLFSSVLQASEKIEPKPAFTIVTGDLLAHHFRERFNAAATLHDDDAFRSFVRKTAEFATLEIKQNSGGAPLIVALGNNDSDCGDYAVQPSGRFLSDSAGFVSNTRSYRQWGSYSMANPALKNWKVIVLNTVFFSPKYHDACGQGTDDPGAGELAWLASELREAKARHEKVWLVYHISPGVDAYATTHGKQTAAGPTMLWKESYQGDFLRLMAEYSDIVGPNFAGHVHVDDFRLLGEAPKSPPFVMLGPSVSPITGQNPTFRVVRFDSHGRLEDHTTYYLKNLTEAGTGATPDWELEYDFGKEWKLPGLNVESYTKLFEGVRGSSEAAERWWLFYSTSRQGGSAVKPGDYPRFYCAAGSLTAEAYVACVSEK
jgi:hypothetical protein